MAVGVVNPSCGIWKPTARAHPFQMILIYGCQGDLCGARNSNSCHHPTHPMIGIQLHPYVLVYDFFHHRVAGRANLGTVVGAPRAVTLNLFQMARPARHGTGTALAARRPAVLCLLVPPCLSGSPGTALWRGNRDVTCRASRHGGTPVPVPAQALTHF